MMKPKKNRPGDCSTRTATEQGQASRQGHTSSNDSITSLGTGQTEIAALLMHGADHAIPLRHLKEMTGFPGRDLRRQIEAARLAGVPICSGEHGYFLAENQREVARFVASMNRRAKRIQAVAAAVEGAEIS